MFSLFSSSPEKTDTADVENEEISKRFALLDSEVQAKDVEIASLKKTIAFMNSLNDDDIHDNIVKKMNKCRLDLAQALEENRQVFQELANARDIDSVASTEIMGVIDSIRHESAWQNDHYSNLVLNLQNVIAEKDSLITKLSERISSNQSNKLNEFSNILLSHQSQKDILSREIKNLVGRIDALIRENETLKLEKYHLLKDSDSNEDNIMDTNDIDTLNTPIMSELNSIDLSKSEFVASEGLQTEILEPKVPYLDVFHEKDQMEMEFTSKEASLRSIIEELERSKLELVEQLSVSQTENQSLQAEIDQLKASEMDWKQNKLQYEEQVKTLESHLKQFDEKHERVLSEQASYVEIITSMEQKLKDVSTYFSSIEQIEDKLKESEEGRLRALQECNDLKLKMESNTVDPNIAIESSNLQNFLNASEKNCSSLSIKLDECERSKLELVEQLSVSQTENQSLQAEIDQLKASEMDWKQNKLQYEEQVKTLESHLKQFDEKHERVLSEQASYVEIITSMEQKLKDVSTYFSSIAQIEDKLKESEEGRLKALQECNDLKLKMESSFQMEREGFLRSLEEKDRAIESYLKTIHELKDKSEDLVIDNKSHVQMIHLQKEHMESLESFVKELSSSNAELQRLQTVQARRFHDQVESLESQVTSLTMDIANCRVAMTTHEQEVADLHQVLHQTVLERDIAMESCPTIKKCRDLIAAHTVQLTELKEEKTALLEKIELLSLENLEKNEALRTSQRQHELELVQKNDLMTSMAEHYAEDMTKFKTELEACTKDLCRIREDYARMETDLRKYRDQELQSQSDNIESASVDDDHADDSNNNETSVVDDSASSP